MSPDQDDTAPASVAVRLGGRTLVLGALTSKRGNAWFATTRNGRLAHAGLRVPESSGEDLPSTVSVCDTDLQFEPVRKYDKEAGAYLEDCEDFQRTRQATGTVMVKGRTHQARVRLTRRRDGDWNVTVKVFPESGRHALMPPPTDDAYPESVLSSRADSAPGRRMTRRGAAGLERALEGPSL